MAVSDLPGWVWLLWAGLWTVGACAVYVIGWHAGAEGEYNRGYEDGLADARVGEAFWRRRDEAEAEVEWLGPEGHGSFRGVELDARACTVFDFEACRFEP